MEETIPYLSHSSRVNRFLPPEAAPGGTGPRAIDRPSELCAHAYEIGVPLPSSR
jgi:hypothetical protein